MADHLKLELLQKQNQKYELAVKENLFFRHNVQKETKSIKNMTDRPLILEASLVLASIGVFSGSLLAFTAAFDTLKCHSKAELTKFIQMNDITKQADCLLSSQAFEMNVKDPNLLKYR